MTDLPPGWAWSTLGALGEYVNGRGFKRSEWSKSGRPIIRIQNLTGSGSEFNYFSGDLDEGHIVQPGDLLVSWAATLGSYLWDGPQGALNQHIFKVTSRIDKRFHKYLIDYQLQNLQSQAHGSGMVHVTRSKFEDSVVIVPPLAEQRRIVSVLDAYLSRLDVATRMVSSSISRLIKFRNSTVNNALQNCSGSTVKLADLIRQPLRNGYSGPATSDEIGVRAVTLSAVTRNSFIEKYTKKAAVVDRKVDDLWLEPGDIFVQRSNTPELVGTSALYQGDPGWAIFPDLLIRVRVNDRIDPEFAQICLSGREIQQRLRSAAKGLSGSMPKIDQATLAALDIPMPEKSEQLEIVKMVKGAEEAEMRIRKQLDIALDHSRSLRRALLGSAFTGCLVEQDPADEPASVLLERIAAERAAAPKPKRTRKTKTMQESAQ